MDVLQGMKVFVQVVESGSITGASEQLGISKAMVSRSLSGLEDHLNVRLMNRTTRKVSLTDAGMTYLQHSRFLLEENARTESLLSTQSQTPSGTLKVSAPISFGLRAVVPVAIDFMKRNPNVVVDISLNDRFVDIVDEGYDLAIRIGGPVLETSIQKKIGEERIVLTIAPSLLKELGQPNDVADIYDWPILEYVGGKTSTDWRKTGKRPNVVMRSNSPEALIDACVAGLGVSRQPLSMCIDRIKKGNLVELFPEELQLSRPIIALYPHKLFLPMKTRAFIDELAEFISQSSLT